MMGIFESFKDLVGVVDDAGDITERLTKIMNQGLREYQNAHDKWGYLEDKLTRIANGDPKDLTKDEYRKIVETLNEVRGGCNILYRHYNTIKATQSKFDSEYTKLKSKVDSRVFPESEREKARQALTDMRAKFDEAKDKYKAEITTLDKLSKMVNDSLKNWVTAGKIVGSVLALPYAGLTIGSTVAAASSSTVEEASRWAGVGTRSALEGVGTIYQTYRWLPSLALYAKQGRILATAGVFFFGGIVTHLAFVRRIFLVLGKGAAGALRLSHDAAVQVARTMGVKG